MRKPSRKCKMCKDYADLTFKDVIGLARGFFSPFFLPYLLLAKFAKSKEKLKSINNP